MKLLHNQRSKKELKDILSKETFKRRTLSFYMYIRFENPQLTRDLLYQEWDELHCLGRIYIAHEGINAQMSVPEHLLNTFTEKLYKHSGLSNVPFKYALDDDGKSFYKLIVKVRPRIVADGLDEGTYDLNNVGKHLSATEFHAIMNKVDSVVIDMRNHYESEIGRFENAYCPDVDTFRDALQLVEKKFEQEKDKEILLYCTGGIRCEKASAYLIKQGFNKVSQLQGGIIDYARQVKELGIESKFIGKNFVFDNRLGETVDGKIISRCHQCGKPADTHINCANNDCHLLFIQCSECATKYNQCCSDDCKHIITLPTDIRKQLRATKYSQYAESKIFKSRLRPQLNKAIQNA